MPEHMTTETAGACRDRMVALLDAGESAHFLTLAAPYLAHVPNDYYIRLIAVREYLKLGLVEPAKELLAPGTEAEVLPPELTALRTQLADVSGGRIPWSRWAGRFVENLVSLSERGVCADGIRDAWAQDQSRFEAFRDNSDGVQVRWRDEHGVWRWIPQLGDHVAIVEEAGLPEDIDKMQPGPYLFEGIDLGHFFQRVYHETLDSFLGFSTPLFVVEPDPAMLAVVFHLHDWRQVLSDERVHIYTGPRCTEQFLAGFEKTIDLPWPRQIFTMSVFRPGCVPTAVEAVRAGTKRRESRILQSLADTEAPYAQRDGRWWADRFTEALSGSGAPLRVLAAVSRHTTFLKHAMRDAKRALEQLGHECRVMTERTDHTTVSPLTYHDMVRSWAPDVFLAIDHVRPEFEGILPANLPILTWDQDQLPHVFTRENLHAMAKHDFLAGCSKSVFVAHGCNPAQALYAPMPTCPEQFSGPPLTEDELARYACDVSYVSHASQTPREFHDEQRAGTTDAGAVHLMDAIYEILPAMLTEHHVASGQVACRAIDEATRRTGISITSDEYHRHLRNWYIWRLGDRIFRHEALSWVAEWAQRTGRTFRIYGNGWDKHPTLSPFAAGPAENGRELLCIHRASRINLQLMPAGFIHQRALDGLASGGFFLSRFTPNDMRGRTLRKLHARMCAIGIDSQRALLASADEELQALLRAYLGPWLTEVDPGDDALFNDIPVVAEMSYPDELFPEFADIVFDSPARFADVAERFLADDALRSRVTTSMRDIVVDRLSYRASMQRFLESMRDYLVATFWRL